jgi:Cys-rich protein (TIGR01571 family)
MSRDWSNGIFGCFNDCSTCIIAYFCPCYVFGKNAEAVGDSCLLCALSQFVPILNLWARVSVRGKIREQKGIEGSCFKDLLCVWCCGICSIVQEAQEIQAPGGQGMARE